MACIAIADLEHRFFLMEKMSYLSLLLFGAFLGMSHGAAQRATATAERAA
jgi:hypothetical protein